MDDTKKKIIEHVLIGAAVVAASALTKFVPGLKEKALSIGQEIVKGMNNLETINPAGDDNGSRTKEPESCSN